MTSTKRLGQAQPPWWWLAREEMRGIVGGEGEPGSWLDLLLQPPPLNPFPPSTGPTFPVPPVQAC